MNPKSCSDLLFEEYLRSQNVGDFEYEKSWSWTDKRPDYSFEWHGSSLIFDVKEFAFQKPPSGSSVYSPYEPIREKINTARIQFAPFKGLNSCSLVLFSHHPMVHLYDADIVLAAMYGDLALRIPYGKPRQESEKTQLSFYRGGKMYRFDSQTLQNTTISAVISLDNLSATQAWERLQGHIDDDVLSSWSVTETSDTKKSIQSVWVFENVFADIPLPDDVFRGPFDQRWGAKDGDVVRTFAGDAYSAIESLSAEE